MEQILREALNKSYEQEFCRRFLFIAVLFLLPLIFILVSMMMGSYHTTPGEIFRIILGKMTGETAGVDEKTVNLFWTIRFPRVMAACLAGAGLSLSGAVFQSMFKNPLASPYTLGVSNGAGFGAALGIVLSLGTIGVQGMSACFGLVSIGVTFLLSFEKQERIDDTYFSGDAGQRTFFFSGGSAEVYGGSL